MSTSPVVVKATAGAIPSPHISRLRWVIILILLLAAIVNYLDRANLSIANTTIAAEFGFSKTEMGLLLSAFLWPYALANLPAGWLVDKFGPKRMFSAALCLWSGFSVLAAFVNSYSFFYGLRMMLGISESPFFTSGIKIIHSWFGEMNGVCPVPSLTRVRRLPMPLRPPF